MNKPVCAGKNRLSSTELTEKIGIFSGRTFGVEHMAASDNRKQVAELKALRDKLNNAERRKEYAIVAEACLEIIALEARAKPLNIIAFLYHKDLGVAYLKLLEYEKSIASLTRARAGLLEYRATQKLKFPEDWLNELKVIEKLISKIERVHLK